MFAVRFEKNTAMSSFKIDLLRKWFCYYFNLWLLQMIRNQKKKFLKFLFLFWDFVLTFHFNYTNVRILFTIELLDENFWQKKGKFEHWHWFISAFHQKMFEIFFYVCSLATHTSLNIQLLVWDESVCDFKMQLTFFFF
jgi:hypothetical protein